MINRIWQKDIFWVSLIILIFTSLYVSTLPQVNVGYSDSDQLLTVASQGGVAHPPGYPLYMLLLSLWIKLPISGSIALKGHLLSSIFSVITLVLIYKTCRYLLKYITTADDNNSTLYQQIIAFISTVSLGITQLYWLYSIVTEVFSLHVLFVVALIYRSIVATLLKPRAKNFWLWNAVILGLAISHHHTIVLITPFIILALWVNRNILTRHHLIQSFAIFIVVTILSYSIILIQNSHNSDFSWQIEPGVRGIIRQITREEFSGTVPETGQQVSAYLPNIDAESIFKFFPKYLSQITIQFNIFIFAISMLGLYFLARKNRDLFLAFTITLLITGPIFAGILGWPDHFGSQANIQRLLLMGYVLWPLIFALGLYLLLTRIRLGMSVFNISPTKTTWVIFTAILFTQLVQIYFTYPQSNLRHFKFTSETYSRLLKQVKPDALIACFTDTSCFALMYEQSVNHSRPDVVIIPRAYPLVAEKLAKQPSLRNFVYDTDPFRTFDYISWNLDKRPVYAVEISEYYFHLLGINEGFIYYVPYGIYGELTKKQPETFPESDFNLSNSILETHIPSTDRMRLYFLSNVIRTYQFNSVIQLRSGFRNQAREELNIAGNLDDYLRLQEPINTNFEQIRRSIESSKPDPRFKPKQVPIQLKEFLSLIEQWKQRRRLDVAHKLAVGAMAVYPDQVDARLAAALTFKEINQIESSILEYRNVLILDPQNVTAIQALEELEAIPSSTQVQQQIIL